MTPERIEEFTRLQSRASPDMRGQAAQALGSRPRPSLAGRRSRCGATLFRDPVVVSCPACGAAVTTTGLSGTDADSLPELQHARSSKRKTSLLEPYRTSIQPVHPDPGDKPMLTNAPFRNIEEVTDYLSGDTIKCLVCGKYFNLLNKHLSDAHGLSTGEYRAQFGIPLDRELSGAQLRAKVQRKLAQYSTNDRLKALAMSAEPFQTMDEVNDYLSGTRIECLVCGKRFHCLTQQHLQLHGLSHDEYRVKFGIPYKRSLTSAVLRDKFRARVTPESIEILLDARARHFESRREGGFVMPPVRPKPPAVTDLLKKNVRVIQRISQTPVTTKCAVCGGDYVTTLAISKRPIRCMNCASTSTKTIRDNYWRKKLGAAYVPLHERQRLECEAFQTREQVDEYLSGEAIECLICGRRFNGLHMHLKFKHGITDDDYRQRYGIPLSRSLTSVTYRAKATAAHAATVACVNCGDEVATSKYHASKPLLCLKCDVSAKGKARAAYWRKKTKIVPPPLTPSSLPHSIRLFGLRRQSTLTSPVKPSPASFAANTNPACPCISITPITSHPTTTAAASESR